MRAQVFAVLVFFLFGACAVEDPMDRPDTFVPPDPGRQAVAYVELKRDFGVLGGMSLLAVDDMHVVNPAYMGEDRVPEVYRRATRSRDWSDGRETIFLAVPVGSHRLGYWFLPGMSVRGMNPFDPGDTIVAVMIEGDLRPNRYYRAHGEETEIRHSYRFWITDINTGQTIASTFVQ